MCREPFVKWLGVLVLACGIIGCDDDRDDKQPVTGGGGGSNQQQPLADGGAARPTTLPAGRAEDPAERARRELHEFVRQAGSFGVLQFRLSQRAQVEPVDAGLKALAGRLVEAHQRADTRLEQLARSKGIRIEEQMTPEHGALFEQVRGVEAAAFQSRFIDLQVRTHRESIDLHERAARELGDAELKQYATEMVPVLKDHLAALEQFAGRGAGQ